MRSRGALGGLATVLWDLGAQEGGSCHLGMGDMALPSPCVATLRCLPIVPQAYLLLEEDIRDLAASDDYR